MAEMRARIPVDTKSSRLIVSGKRARIFRASMRTWGKCFRIRHSRSSAEKFSRRDECVKSTVSVVAFILATPDSHKGTSTPAVSTEGRNGASILDAVDWTGAARFRADGFSEVEPSVSATFLAMAYSWRIARRE